MDQLILYGVRLAKLVRVFRCFSFKNVVNAIAAGNSIIVLSEAGTGKTDFAVANPGKDIFLDMLEIELDLPSDRHIREVMKAKAQKQVLQISKSRLAELQPLVGRNPMLVRKIIKNEALVRAVTK